MPDASAARVVGTDAVGARPGPGPVLKQVDAWWTVLLVDPLAVRLVGAARRVPAVTPTHLTAAAHLLGLAAAALFAAGHLLAAAVVYEARFVLDCADGKLARVQGRSSRAGAYLDYLGDNLVAGVAMVGLALHLTWAAGAPPLVAVGLPAAFLAHIVAGQARSLEAARAGGGDRPGPGRAPGRYRRWMAARRLRPLPCRVDVEHGLLFLAPVGSVLLGRPGLLVGAAWVATGYFGYRAARMTAAGYRIAARYDAGGRPAP